jgi:pimeloyl-ACP methyl ester carboxylesterase
VALAEGHAVLDSIRAVATLPGVGALGDVVVAGHSQGGRAALSAAEIAPAYAPDLNLVGAVALAPGVELPALAEHLAESPLTGDALIGAIGLRAGYPDLDLSTVFTASAIADVPRIETECLDTTFARYQTLATRDVISHDAGALPELQSLLEDNSPGAVAPTIPILLAHGEDDQQVPVDLSGRLEAKYCALGVTDMRHTYPGQDHDEVVDAAVEDALTFIADRFDHRPATGTC